MFSKKPLIVVFVLAAYETGGLNAASHGRDFRLCCLKVVFRLIKGQMCSGVFCSVFFLAHSHLILHSVLRNSVCCI